MQENLSLNTDERILLHLLNFTFHLEADHSSFDITQEGISGATHSKRSNVTKALKNLKKSELVQERKVNIKGMGRIRKGYFLTDKGYRQARELESNVLGQRIRVIDQNRLSRDMEIRELETLIGRRVPVIALLHGLSGEGILDLSELSRHLRNGGTAEASEQLPAPDEADDAGRKAPKSPRTRELEERNLSPLVGRGEEMDLLKDFFKRASEGHGQILILKGETGIGKSRLVDELEAWLPEGASLFLRGGCIYHEGADPYMPFISILRRCGEVYPDILKDLVDSGSGLSQFLLLAAEVSSGSTSKSSVTPNFHIERENMFEIIQAFVERVSKERSLVIFIDDLQWADNGTLQLFHYLARTSRHLPLMMAGAYRPEDLKDNPFLLDTLRRMSRERLMTELTLHRLSREETESMVENILKRKPSPQSVKEVFFETEGNPFFIEELLLSIMGEGTVTTIGGLAELPKVETPRSIMDVMARRIEALDERERKLLECASVIGSSFSFEMIEELSGYDDYELVEALDVLVEKKLIVEILGEEISYEFIHSKVQEVVYRSMSRPRRRLLHKRAGEIAEELYREEPDVFDLARHFSRGGDYEKGFHYAIVSAQRTSELYATDSIISFYELALEMLRTIRTVRDNQDVDTVPSEIYINSQLEYVHFLSGNWDKAFECAEKMMALSEEAGNRYTAAEAYRMVGKIKESLGQFDEAFGYFERSKGICEDVDDSNGLAKSHKGMGRVLWREGRYEDAIVQYQKALEHYRGTRGSTGAASTSIDLGNIYFERGEFDIAIECHEKGLELLGPEGDEYELARLNHNLGVAYGKRGMYGEAIEYYKRSIELAQRCGHTVLFAWALFNIAESLAEVGDIDNALENCNESFRIFSKLDYKLGISGALNSFGIIYQKKKEYTKAEENLKSSIEIRKGLGIPYRLADGYRTLAGLYKETGKSSEARDNLLKARDIFSELDARRYVEEIEKELKDL